jgi:hypothetical protein
MKKNFAMTCQLGLLLVASIMPANAYNPTLLSYTSIAAAPGGGFWIQISNGPLRGRTVSMGGAPNFGSVDKGGSIVAVPGRNGYWVVGTDYTVTPKGDAPALCPAPSNSCGSFNDPKDRVVGAAATPDGGGIWMATLNGKIFTVGTARPYGDALSAIATTGIVGTPSGKGYYIVRSNGGVSTRGDAAFLGSLENNLPRGQAITGIALSLNAAGQPNGYWLVGVDGGVYALGSALFLGSTGGGRIYDVTNILAINDARAYVWVHVNGNVESSREFLKVTIRSLRSGNNITVANGSPYGGRPLTQATPSGSISQRWYVYPAGAKGQLAQFKSVDSNMCMDISLTNHPQMIEWPCKGSNNWDNQIWKISDDLFGVLLQAASSLPQFLGVRGIESGDPIVLFRSHEIPTLGDVSWQISDR